MDILQAYLSLSKVLPELLNKQDLAIWATDMEKFLIFDTYGRFNIKLKAGDLLTPGGTPALVVQTRQKITRMVPRDVYGVICQTTAIPVEGGAIGISLGVENEYTLQASLSDLDQAFEQIGDSGHRIADNAGGLSDFMNTLLQTVEATNGELQKIDNVGSLIKGIADRSRLISLNALIESARAGEHGRSFSVVAKEMQKLSEETAKSILNVRTTLENIHTLFDQVQSLIHEAESKVRTQSAATQEIASALQEVAVSVRDIGKLSKVL
ncbi:methyl-accepting chemotaxis protein [Tumebacillus permanentifrigoris]|uniref:Methyl-accepting chemotaxis protein (MCP) signaling protein n=1 Tax=Tumebacillus permanentifrigoris TaxID=378543 RepID=A0A316DA65_9BACL|nr:methyl-accepting chemotaxis protein [Tumebacillus permanentifrigoris]PWK13391.1 methyl-accepting chemotaxis protein (MCP) signaling protein [Tumebacillus permanentifrigoris]